MDNNNNQLQASKEFNCSKETLFAAWTEQEQLKQWWKPLGLQLQDVTNDIREGGTVKYTFEGEALVITGTYKKVENQDLLEYSWTWEMKSEPVNNAEYQLSVNFKGDSNSSSISITQTGFQNHDSIQPHQQGWEQALQQLSEYLEGENQNDVSGKPPITGYNETPEQLKVGGA